MPPSGMRTRVELGVDVHGHAPIGASLLERVAVPLRSVQSSWESMTFLIAFRLPPPIINGNPSFAQPRASMRGPGPRFSWKPRYSLGIGLAFFLGMHRHLDEATSV